MANLVNGAVVRYAAEITFAAIDSNGVTKERTKEFAFASGVVLYADALNALSALVTALIAINEADIVRHRVISIFDTVTGPVTLVGNLQREAVLTLRINGSSTKKAAHSIIAPSDQNVSGNSVVVDADMRAYLDKFEAGGDFTISDGEQISADSASQVAASGLRTVKSRLIST